MSKLDSSIAATSTAVMILALGASAFLAPSHASSGEPGSAGASSRYVGSAACANCHPDEARLWRGSHHERAMDHATENSVLGDFSAATFDYDGLRSRFFRKDGKYFVETDGPDGRLAVFEVKYTFGSEPLQQYLIAFPDGRLQALSIAWDSRPKTAGGQRWFHLYPDEHIHFDDALHWTKLNQNWNFMCAECHSTGVRKNYDAAKDRFATTFAEISVGCETCHGPGSRHVDWARRSETARSDDKSKGLDVSFDERRDIVWNRDPTRDTAHRNSPPAILRKEVETCGLCHARRSTLFEAWVPGRSLTDTHRVVPLTRGAYFADGQMDGEAYNYGSFKQSKMFAAGVTCSDCHDPHSGKLRLAGDETCLQCHAAKAYQVTRHHRHEGPNPPPTCASCHMPRRTYMVVDPRHDHGFRVPRPDLSMALGTPNTCNDCHEDKTAQWAAAAIERWHGRVRRGFQTYAEAFHAAWTSRADAAALLAAVGADPKTPAFARAGALAELAPFVSPAHQGLVKASLADPDPMVRVAALDMIETVPAAGIWPLVAPLLADPDRSVRTKAASLLASVPSAIQPPADREAFERAAAEFVAAQRLDADRPEARSALGSFFARRGSRAEAEAEFEAALRLDPRYAPAAVNLADLYRTLGREGDGEKVLRAALERSPEAAALDHALGLLLVRLQRHAEALTRFEQAARKAPDQPRYAYVHGVALHSAGETSRAIAVLEENLARHPADRDTLVALVDFCREAGDVARALDHAEKLASLDRDDPSVARLVETLRRQVQKRRDGP